MELTNTDMEAMLASAEKHLGRRDVIGYAAARNTRVLRDELSEFMQFRNDLVLKHGDEDENGKTISPNSAGFAAFMEEYMPLCDIKHEPELFTVPYDEAIGVLSGSELLEIDWMFRESE